MHTSFASIVLYEVPVLKRVAFHDCFERELAIIRKAEVIMDNPISV